MRYRSILFLWMVASGCGAPASLQKPVNSESILRHLYGNYDQASKSATFETQDDRILSWLYQEEPLGEIPPNQATVLSLDEVQHAGRDLLFAVIAIRPDPAKLEGWGCAICGPLLRFMSFASAGESAWKKETDQYLSVRGNWGRPPEIRIEKMGAQHYGYVLTSLPIVSFTNSERQTIVGLGDGGFSDFLAFESFDEADPERCPGKSCWTFRTELKFTGSDAPFFDLRLETRGSKLDAKDRRISADEVRCYKYQDAGSEMDGGDRYAEIECSSR